MRKNILAILLALASPLSAQAAAIVVAAELDNGISLSDGSTSAPTGNQIRVGTFLQGGIGGTPMSDAQIASMATNPVALAANFVQFGVCHIGDSYGQAGFFASTLIADSTALGLGNSQLYLWFIKTFGNEDPNENFSNLEEQGIFYADMASVPSWRIRMQNDSPNTTKVDLSDLTDANGTALIPGAHIVLGGFPSATNNAVFNKPNFTLQRIPEPGSAILLIAATGVVGLVRRQR